MTFLELPNEIIQNILRYLSVNEVLSLSLVNTRLRDVCNISEVWRYRCRKDYKIDVGVNASEKFTPKDLYLKLLNPYGCLIGLWQPSIASYGGLLQIKYDAGFLHANELHAPNVRKITENLRVKPLFKIGLNGRQIIKCCIKNDGETATHQANVNLKERDVFDYSCSDVLQHRSEKARQEEFMDWLSEEGQEPEEAAFNQELLLMKFLVIRQYNLSYEYSRLRWPLDIGKKEFPIQPGLFKGTYGAHGLELIMLSYDECGTRAKAEKITGDPNIPANQVTFHVNLDFPILNLTLDDQERIASLNAIQNVEIKFNHQDRVTKPQVFRLPSDCYERSHNIPNTCIERFHGWGQIANHGFSSPSFTKGHWIVFNEDIFGFLWLDLSSLSMYHRVRELSSRYS